MKKLLTLLIITLFVSVGLFADWGNEEKEIAFDGDAEDRFGYSVSISGDYAVIGAYRDDDFTGSAYIFYYNGSDWSMQVKLTASDGSTGDRFGWSVSISGDYVVVGAYKDNYYGTNSGSAYIFQRSGTSWPEQDKLTPSDGAMGDWFGFSVSISGDYAVIATPYDDDNGDDSGSAYIFYYDGSSWSMQEKLTASDGSTFGNSVSISGDFAVIGASADDENGYWSGSAYIFHRSGTSWSQEDKLTASDGISWDRFGWSVSISGDYAVIGVPFDDDNGSASGSAYIFYRCGTSWAEQTKLTASNASADDRFGRAVSISGDYAVVGAMWDDDNGSNSGSANIFQRNGSSWSQQGLLTASDGAAYDDFGISVSISGDFAVIGASGDDDNGDDSGSTYFYENLYIAVNPSSVQGIEYPELKSAYPNPFNPTTTISFSIPNDNEVELTVYNIIGQKIKTIAQKEFNKGYHSINWNGDDELGKMVSSGIYFYKLNVNGKTEAVKKCLLLK